MIGEGPPAESYLNIPRIISAAGVMRAFVTRDAAPDIPAAREEDVIWARRIVADLLAREAVDPRAAEAVALFCYQAKKWIGSFAAALGGLDTLVFSGGIGENAPLVRERICAGLGFLGIKLSRRQNSNNAQLISPRGGRTKIRVIRTDEELMIAISTSRFLKAKEPRK